MRREYLTIFDVFDVCREFFVFLIHSLQNGNRKEKEKRKKTERERETEREIVKSSLLSSSLPLPSSLHIDIAFFMCFFVLST